MTSSTGHTGAAPRAPQPAEASTHAAILGRLIGGSSQIEELRGAIQRVAGSDRPVLVLGPTGVGKELVVSSIHGLSARGEAPLLDVNCGAIPAALIESHLFGHERGAFTGAERRQLGYLSMVGTGTLFLDEIAELPLPLQARLLRVLETRRFRPVGGAAEEQFQGRVIAATHADLAERVRQGGFRADLFYRLNVICLRVPPLHERREDIPLLVQHFAAQQPRPLRFTPAALELLADQRWPGNVRQLRNVVDAVAVFADDEIVTPRVLLPRLGADLGDSLQAPPLRQVVRAILQLPLRDKLNGVVDAAVDEALGLCEGNKTAAARLLGVHRKVIERRLRARRHDGGPPRPAAGA